MRSRFAWPVLIAYVLAFGASGLAMAYANRVARDSEQRWCGIVTTLDDAYRATPPATPTGQQLAANISRLRADIGC